MIDTYVIMPNHIHMLLNIRAGGDGTPPLRVYDIIGRLKSYTTYKYGQPLWQRSFWDHVIRNRADYDEIYKYIEENPAKWTADKFYEE